MIRFDNHAFRGLDSSMKELFDVQLAMGDAIRSIMALVPTALQQPNPEHFIAAKKIDKTINEAELKAERMVGDIIAKYGVSGDDLRYVIGSVKVSGTLERIADKTKNCIKRLGKVGKPLAPQMQAELAKANAALQYMISLALAQVVDYQEPATRELLRHGATVQHSYRHVLGMLQNDATIGEDETHITLIAKNMEQAADMLVEIMKIGHLINFGQKYEKESA